jgi:heme exporter protein CcmD
MGFLEAGTRWEYVTAAYLATFAIMALLVWATMAQARRARRDLEALESSDGPRRRRAS